MSCALHGVEHCPLCDPLPPNHPPPEPRASQFNMAIGTDGNPLPYSAEEVKRVALNACCGCHSGFLFDIQSCSCLNPLSVCGYCGTSLHVDGEILHTGDCNRPQLVEGETEDD